MTADGEQVTQPAAVCTSCEAEVGAEDIFCGTCRRPRSAFFTHATAEDPGSAGEMSDMTRYLCAAAYLDSSFANTVLKEFLGARRAVVPSRGFDLVPVIRHCLKARRMRLGRDIALTIISIPFYIAFAAVLVSVAGVFWWFGQWMGPRWRRPSSIIKLAVMAAMLWAAVLFAFALVVSLVLGATSLGAYGTTSGPSPGSVSNVLLLFVVAFAIYAAAFAAVTVTYYFFRNRALRTWLGFGAMAPSWAEDAWATKRMAAVGAAQHGNLTIYGGEDPFLGAGVTPLGWRSGDNAVSASERAWSIAIELNRGSGTGSGPVPDDTVPGEGSRIDAGDVYRVLSERFLSLKDNPGLLRGERIEGVSVDDYVVGEGQFPLSAPLIDPEKLIPYSRVSDDAVAALKGSPQAGLRCYQRVSIRDTGQSVLAGGLPVIGAVDQEVVVSAFVYVAVEGGMFYLQFVPTSLGPVQDAFRVVDYLPALSPAAFAGKVVRDTARNWFQDVTTAPAGVFRAWRDMWRENQAASRAGTEISGGAYADIGARISVRQLAALPHPRTYIQQLDVAKYTQILERLVLETVLDYLKDHQVDTGAYRSSMQAIYNSGVIVGGSISGSTVSVNSEGRK